MFVTTFGDFHQTLIKTLVVNIIMIVMGFQLHIANIPITASVTCCASHSIFTCENISPVTHLLALAANNSTSKFDVSGESSGPVKTADMSQCHSPIGTITLHLGRVNLIRRTVTFSPLKDIYCTRGKV